MADSEESWKSANDDSWASKTANDGNWASTTANETQVEGNTGVGSQMEVADYKSAPLEPIGLGKSPTMAILTDSNGEVARIGGLKNSGSPTCRVTFESVTENYESYLYVQARFPRSPSESRLNPQPFQYMGFRFYGDAFQSFDRDFLLTRIMEAANLPDILKADTSVVEITEQKGGIFKLELTYQPDKVITRSKDDPEEFLMPESSHSAQLLRGLVETEGPKTLTLCFRANGKRIEALNTLKDRLMHEQDIMPFQEYRDVKGEMIIQYGAAGTGPEVDRTVIQKTQCTFRTAEQHAATLAYGEMRDHTLTIDLARSTLTRTVTVSFVEIPGWLNDDQMPSKYIAFVDIMDTSTIGQLFQAGTKATLCWEQPKTKVEPNGWLCEVKPEIPNVEHPGTLTLLVTRPEGDEFDVKTAKFPSLDMAKESSYDVWVYPDGEDKACKRLVDCAKKVLHGEPAESPEHISSRLSMQKFCSGRELNSMPKPPQNLFDLSKLTDEQRNELETIKAHCSPDQLAVLEKICSCQSAVHMLQGPPGTGKTTFAAETLLPVFDLFGLKANCYASSNAATDVFAAKVPPSLRAIRYHGLGKEILGLDKYGFPEESSDVPQYIEQNLSEDELVWMNVLTAATVSNSWLTPGKKERPNFLSLALYIRAFQHAGIMDAKGVLAELLPETVSPQYLTWARMFYALDEDTNVDEDGEENDLPTFKQLTQQLFEDTLNDSSFVITTCSNAADETLRKNTTPHVVIIDEVGVSKELETWMAMYHNLSSACLFIFLGDHKQLSPTVPSLHVKRVADDETSPPYNIFAMQLNTSFMSRQLESGMEYSMFSQQFRMTSGIEDFSSRLCYNGRLQNAECTLLANRPQSQSAIRFLKGHFNLDTEVPHLCMNVHSGVCLKSRTMSRGNVPNVVVDLYVIEEVVKANIFTPSDITIITPYKEQAHLIRQALGKASQTDFWKDKDIGAIKVHTVDSMQGNESPMVITDFVLAKKREGRLGFVTNRGRINVSMSRAQYFQVFVGDLAAADPIRPKDPVIEDEESADVEEDANSNADDVQDHASDDDSSDEDVLQEASDESSGRPLDMLFKFYEKSGVVVETDHKDKAQVEYVDLTQTNAFIERGKPNCRNCNQPGHIAKDCDQPNQRLICHRCSTPGHTAKQCSLPKPDFCHNCKQEGHKTSYCPTRVCFKCKEIGHSVAVCTGPERRTCVRCEEVGHIVKECKERRFKSRYPGPPKVNFEAGKSASNQTATVEQGASSAWDTGNASSSTVEQGASSAWDSGNASSSTVEPGASSAWDSGNAYDEEGGNGSDEESGDAPAW